jgi:lipoprotein-anchoring transpeptidase ErfK/SrfK
MADHPERHLRGSAIRNATWFAVVIVGLAGAITAVEARPSSGARAKAAAAVVVTRTAPTSTLAAPTTLPAPEVPVSTLLAAPRGSIPTYSRPGAMSSGRVGTWYGYSLVLPVIGQQPGWLQVRLPQRPNGSTAWVQTGDVSLSSTPYRIVVNLGTEHLVVYQAGYPSLSFPVGIGVSATPTVTGNYFVAVREPSDGPAYGPFVLDTSAHSEAIQSWEGKGDAIIAIHGPITPSADARIGTTGTRISNGCIRLHDSDLAQLAMIPLGTPVDIVAGG